MGSDIQFPAISAKGYDFFMSHADERTLSISLINLELLFLLPFAERTCSLADSWCVECQKIGSRGCYCMNGINNSMWIR